MSSANDFRVEEVWSQHSDTTSVVLHVDGFDFWMSHERAGQMGWALMQAAGRNTEIVRRESPA